MSTGPARRKPRTYAPSPRRIKATAEGEAPAFPMRFAKHSWNDCPPNAAHWALISCTEDGPGFQTASALTGSVVAPKHLHRKIARIAKDRPLIAAPHHGTLPVQTIAGQPRGSHRATEARRCPSLASTRFRRPWPRLVRQ